MNNAPTPRRTALCTMLALTAFAANSILCRLALEGPAIDAASFTTVRLLSGALTLLVFSSLASKSTTSVRPGSWWAASLLFLYAVSFPFAYLSLSAGTGALILFAAVQLTMILAALLAGERPAPLEWLGLVAALAGLVYLVSPGLSAPSAARSLLMGLAGISWGLYSLLGRGVRDPVAVTTGNFVRSVPFTLLVSAVAFRSLELSGSGALLATVSGALTSGLGYGDLVCCSAGPECHSGRHGPALGAGAGGCWRRPVSFRDSRFSLTVFGSADTGRDWTVPVGKVEMIITLSSVAALRRLPLCGLTPDRSVLSPRADLTPNCRSASLGRSRHRSRKENKCPMETSFLT